MGHPLSWSAGGCSIHRQIVSAIDLVVQLQVMVIGGRRAKVVSDRVLVIGSSGKLAKGGWR